MIETVYAQLRFVASLVFGIPFDLHSLDRLLAALLEARYEFGGHGGEFSEALGGLELDEETRRQMQLRRFRTQAVRGARETAYYGRLFESLALDPKRLDYEDIGCIPPTPKGALRADPDAFIRRTARPVFRASTTGTTGSPTSIAFSAEEMGAFVTLGAINLLSQHSIDAQDIVQISTSSRAMLGNLCFGAACARLGALVYQTGLVEPEQALALLAEEHRFPGKVPRASVLLTYPSYLGELLECGLRLGYRPADFCLKRVSLGGEIVTAGLKVRCQELFGPVQFEEAYGMTEPWPCGGTRCSHGHLHFETSSGLLEVLNLEDSTPARPSEPGVLVITPFPPHRQTTILLRYDTGDVVRPIDGPLTCELRSLPATSNILGKLHLSVRHERGWTFPRDVLEALEAVEAVPLPARCSFWAVPGGVAVEVVVRANLADAYGQIATRLQEQGVPLQQLYLLEDRPSLRQPFPWRCDLREASFAARSGEEMLYGPASGH